jgi:hypothetical protein
MDNNGNELLGENFEVKNEIHVKPKKVRGPYKTKKKLAAMGLVTNSGENNDIPVFSHKPQKIGVIDFDELKNSFENNLDSPENTGNEESEVIETGNNSNNPAINITGDMLLAVVDTIAPIIAVIGLKVVTKGKKKVKINVFRLTEDERKILEPSADAAAAEILGNLSPTQLFIFTLLSIYAGKVIGQMGE